MRRTTPRLLAAGAASLALFLAACGGDDDDSSETQDPGSEGTEDTGSDEMAEGGSFTFATGEPQFMGPPGNCYESNCSTIMQLIAPPLFEVDAESGDLIPRVAQGIEANDDSTEFTITLKEGFKFENGEPVNADAYIRAWNYNAYGPNATQTGSTWWNVVEGFEDVQGEVEVDDEGNVTVKEEPKKKELSGLTKIDDLTFEVKLSRPFSQFPISMSYAPAVAPAAEACLDDTDACNEKPIGYGPYLFDGKWQHDQQIVLKKNPEYPGENTGHADEIVFKIYGDMSNALRDYQAGNVDLMTPLPEELPQAEQAAEGRLLREPSSSFMFLGLPNYEPGLDNPDVRKALSMAIDRQALIDNIFNGVGIAATDVITPVVLGYEEGACEACQYNPEEAKKLWDAADPPIEELTIYFNEGAGHETWTEAAGNMWRDTLGIDFKLEPNPWPKHLEKLGIGVNDPEGAADNKNAMHGPFRLGWLMDYPSSQNYLDPLYGPEGSSNYTTWRNEDFNDAMKRGNANSDAVAATENEYREAADIVIEDMPIIPITFGESIRVYSERIDTLNYDTTRTEVRLEEVTVVDQ